MSLTSSFTARTSSFSTAAARPLIAAREPSLVVPRIQQNPSKVKCFFARLDAAFNPRGDAKAFGESKRMADEVSPYMHDQHMLGEQFDRMKCGPSYFCPSRVSSLGTRSPTYLHPLIACRLQSQGLKSNSSRSAPLPRTSLATASVPLPSASGHRAQLQPALPATGRQFAQKTIGGGRPRCSSAPCPKWLTPADRPTPKALYICFIPELYNELHSQHRPLCVLLSTITMIIVVLLLLQATILPPSRPLRKRVHTVHTEVHGGPHAGGYYQRSIICNNMSTAFASHIIISSL